MTKMQSLVRKRLLGVQKAIPPKAHGFTRPLQTPPPPPSESYPSPQAVAAVHNKVKAAVWTIAFVSITITGTMYGASLKDSSKVKQKSEVSYDDDPTEQLRMLEARRFYLADQKRRLEEKIDGVRARAGERQQKEDVDTRNESG